MLGCWRIPWNDRGAWRSQPLVETAKPRFEADAYREGFPCSVSSRAVSGRSGRVALLERVGPLPCDSAALRETVLGALHSAFSCRRELATKRSYWPVWGLN